MTINRKDTILIAVLMNIGLLTVLFITAMSYEDDKPKNPVANYPERVHDQQVGSSLETLQLTSTNEFPTDEVDQVIQEYEAQNNPVPTPPSPEPVQNDKYVEITVKRGDSLDRIARANKTTIREIMKLNNLSTDRLRIGQILKIPLPDAVISQASGSSPSSGAQFYELKSGDNPWKVAKKFNVSYESIIELNDLTESKAKALKPGDKIRIK